MRTIYEGQIGPDDDVLGHEQIEAPDTAAGSVYYFTASGEDISSTEQSVSFQDGPIAEHGVNGIQVEHLLMICIDRLDQLNVGEHQNEATTEATQLINDALDALATRTAERTARGVEGTSAA